jgi:hypothetical protein
MWDNEVTALTFDPSRPRPVAGKSHHYDAALVGLKPVGPILGCAMFYNGFTEGNAASARDPSRDRQYSYTFQGEQFQFTAWFSRSGTLISARPWEKAP